MVRFLQTLVELSSILSLSLILLDNQSCFRELLEECGILGFLEKEDKGRVGKRKRTQGLATTTSFAHRYRVACMFSSLVYPCMAYACGLLFMMVHQHGRLPGLIVDFLNLFISWIVVVILDFFPCFVLVGSHVYFILS